MAILLILLAMLVARSTCCTQPHAQPLVVQVNMQRGTIASLTYPLKGKEITWTELEEGQKAFNWGKRLIFTDVQGPPNKLYRCHSGNFSALVNITVSDGPTDEITRDTIIHCQHGKPCAVTCPSDDYDLPRWPGVVLDKELWRGEEWKNVHLQGEDPMMISPGVLIADLLRNPTLAVCRKTYLITEEGSDVTGLPQGTILQGHAKKVRLEIAKPYSHIVRPTRLGLSKTAVMSVVEGQRAEITCEGFAWDSFDEMYWLKSPCRDDNECDKEFVDEERGRVYERENANTTLVNNALGYPLSKTLILDPVVESDLKGAFFCKLDSTGLDDVVTLHLKVKDREAQGPRRKSRTVGMRKRAVCKGKKESNRPMIS